MTDIVTEVDDQTLENAVDILRRFVSDNDAKLRYGANQRELIRKTIERGERPDHYRYEWMLVTVKDLFAFLGQKCQEFNAAHPQDRCSQQDLADVLNTAIHRIKSK